MSLFSYPKLHANSKFSKMTSVSITSPNKTTVKINLNIVSILTSLGIGIYTAVILGTANKDDVSAQIYAFVLTTCIVQFISAFITTIETITNKKSACSSLIGLITLGLFIWSCVILFDQIGINNRSANPYYTVVFVYFIISVVCLGLVIVLLPFICCAMYCILVKDKEVDASINAAIDAASANNVKAAIDNLNNVLKKIDEMKEPATVTATTTTATVPTITTTTNVTVQNV